MSEHRHKLSLAVLVGTVVIIVIGICALNPFRSDVSQFSTANPIDTAAPADTRVAPVSSNAASINRALVIDPSSMPIDGGTATLTIGMLQRVDGVYSGDYKVDVTPYFFKNEKGRLAIVVSDASMALINHGKIAAIIGTATSNGEDGISRHIDATATPTDIDHGTLKIWFTAGDRKMTFEPAYHFSEGLTENAVGQSLETNLALNLSHGK